MQSWSFHAHTHTQAVRVSGCRPVLPLWDFLALVVQIALVGFTCVCFALVHQLSCITSWLWETGLLVDFSPLPPCLPVCMVFLITACFPFFFFCMTFAEFCFFHVLLLAPCSLRTCTRTHGLKKKRHGIRVAFIQNHRDFKRTAECLIVIHTSLDAVLLIRRPLFMPAQPPLGDSSELSVAFPQVGGRRPHKMSLH